jgi:hypothetical protein
LHPWGSTKSRFGGLYAFRERHFNGRALLGLRVSKAQGGTARAWVGIRLVGEIKIYTSWGCQLLLYFKSLVFFLLMNS